MNTVNIPWFSISNFNSIVTTEVMPNIFKAFASISNSADANQKNALLFAAAEHINDILSDWCIECRDMMMNSYDIKQEDIDTIRKSIIFQNANAEKIREALNQQTLSLQKEQT